MREMNSRAPGSPSCSTTIRASQPALPQQRQQREEVRLRARDAGHLLHVQHLRHRAASTTRSAHLLDRMVARRSVRAARPRSRAAAPVPPRAARADGRRAPPRRPARSGATDRCRDERLEPLARDDDGQPGCGRFVDDLVQRAGAHVVDEHVAACVHRGCLGLRHGPFESNAAPPARARRSALRARADASARRRSATARAARLRPRRRRDAAPPRSRSRAPWPATCAPARASLSVPSSARRRGPLVRHLDAVAGRDDLARGQRERLLGDAERPSSRAARRAAASATAASA